MKKTKILVTGSDGQLGKELRFLGLESPFEWIFTTRKELDIANESEVAHILEKEQPDWVINTAAYTAVDKAETETELCYLINTIAPGNLARQCSLHHSKLIHISTDYVYHNQENRPLLETDPCTPANTYGKSKLDGELAVKQNCRKSVIIRTSWVYSVYGHNFVKTMLHLAGTKEKIEVVNDQIGSPTHAGSLASAIVSVINYQLTHPDAAIYDTYNFSDEGVCSWYDFATFIIAASGHKLLIDPTNSQKFVKPAARPSYSVMDKSHIRDTFGLKIRHWTEPLKEVLSVLGKA